ncbi:MAG: hypothetical protein R2749_05195 [Acidimicrobiales bacterium]
MYVTGSGAADRRLVIDTQLADNAVLDRLRGVQLWSGPVGVWWLVTPCRGSELLRARFDVVQVVVRHEVRPPSVWLAA